MGLVLVCLITVMIIAIPALSLTFNIWPWQLFSSELSNREFDALMHLVFTDPNAKLTEFNIIGGGYECWVCNGYWAFEINKVKHFSPWQKVKFFHRLKMWKRIQQITKEDRLHRRRLAEVCFTKQVDSILEEE